jgi:hypothetical protein
VLTSVTQFCDIDVAGVAHTVTQEASADPSL